MPGVRLGFVWIALLLFASLSACSRIQGMYIVDTAISDGDTVSTSGAKPPGPINLDTYVFPEDLPITLKYADTDIGKAYTEEEFKKRKRVIVLTDEEITPAFSRALKSKEHRNRLQADIIRRSNEICTAHKGKILANQAIFSFSTRLLSTILSGVSAAVGGEVVKSALSTAAAAAGATGAEIDANFYQNLLATAILNKIDELRTTEYNRILDEQKKSPENYTVNQAVLDAANYHANCSFFVGVMALATDKQEELTFEQIQARIAALQKENEGLTQIIAAGDQRKLAAETQLRLNETEILRLKVLSRSASGAPASGQAEEENAEQ